MFVLSFGLILMVSIAANCDNNKNVLSPPSSEENNYEYFKSLANISHGGLGTAYVRQQMEKHDAWYHRKRHDRTRIFQSSKLQTNVIAKSRAPFKVADISDDYRDQMIGIGIGINMLKKAANYSAANIMKSADSVLYLNMKLRPIKSDVIPPHKFTKTEIENLLVTANGSTLFLESVRRINPEYYKNLTSSEIVDMQTIKDGKISSHNVMRLSGNLTKPVLNNNRTLSEFKPVPILIRQLNVAASLHQTSILLFILLLVIGQNVQNCYVT